MSPSLNPSSIRYQYIQCRVSIPCVRGQFVTSVRAGRTGLAEQAGAAGVFRGRKRLILLHSLLLSGSLVTRQYSQTGPDTLSSVCVCVCACACCLPVCVCVCVSVLCTHVPYSLTVIAAMLI